MMKFTSLAVALIHSLRHLHRPVAPPPTTDTFVPTGDWKGRAGSKANHSYYYKYQDTVTRLIPQYDWHDDKGYLIEGTDSAGGTPMRRGHRKGVNTCPKPAVSSLHSISFSR